MVTGKNNAPRAANVRTTRLRGSLCLLLVLLAGCKWPSARLKSELQADHVAPLAQNETDKKERGAKGATDDGHCDPATGPAASLAGSASKKDKNDKPVADVTQLSIDKLLQRGYGAAKKGNIDEAKKAYLEVLRRQPDQSVAHHRLAIIADSQGDFRTAEFHYQSALRLNASDPDLLNDMGYSFLLQGDYQQSEQFLGEALAMKPAHRHAQNNLALLHSLRGDYDAAAEVLRKAHSEQEAEAKLAKLFPHGRPETPLVEETASLSAVPSPTPLRAPDLRGGLSAAPEGARVSANSSVAAIVAPVDSQIPTARFTGHVAPDSNTIGNDRAIGSDPPVEPQVNLPATYSAELPTGRNDGQLPTATSGRQLSDQQDAQALEKWNRLPVSFSPPSGNGATGQSEVQFRANAPVAVANADYVVGAPGDNAAPRTRSASPVTTTDDPLASMPAWPPGSVPPVEPTSYAGPSEQLPPGTSPASMNVSRTTTSSLSVINDLQRAALVLGLNSGPGSLFPVISQGTRPPVREATSDVTSRMNDVPARPSMQDRLEDPAATTPTLQPERQTAPFAGTNAAAAPVTAVPHGTPQYPSTGRAGMAYPGSLPQTDSPTQRQPAFQSGSFQAMP